MIKKHDLLELLKGRPGPFISLYMPTHRSAPDSEQDPIRFKNMLRLVKDELIREGIRSSDASNLLAKAEKLHYDSLFWSHQIDGLVLFIAPDFLRVERVPLKLEPEYKISNRFYIKPLLPLVDAHRRFFILALSQDQAELYEATPHSLSQISLDSAPQSVESLLPDRRVDAALQFHTGGPSSQGQKSAAPVYHGHAITSDKEEADILRYLREVDRAVYGALKGEDGPLVLASVGFLASLYESVNSYGHLMRAKIPGNPDSWTEQELHAKACEIVQTELAKPLRQSLQKFQDAFATPRTSSCVEEIVRAAYEGRVETLFATTDLAYLGEYDASKRAVELDSIECGDDLIDLAAAKTLENGGTVFAIDSIDDIDESVGQAENPKFQPMAAILRYAVTDEGHSNSMA